MPRWYSAMTIKEDDAPFFPDYEKVSLCFDCVLDNRIYLWNVRVVLDNLAKCSN